MSADHWIADLRKHWTESADRERANPLAGKPTHEAMLATGLPIDTALKDGTTIWVIEPGSIGVFQAFWMEPSWWIAEAGELWPSNPTQWLPVSGPDMKDPRP